MVTSSMRVLVFTKEKVVLKFYNTILTCLFFCSYEDLESQPTAIQQQSLLPGVK